jgi:hypothetical protein
MAAERPRIPGVLVSGGVWRMLWRISECRWDGCFFTDRACRCSWICHEAQKVRAFDATRVSQEGTCTWRAVVEMPTAGVLASGCQELGACESSSEFGAHKYLQYFPRGPDRWAAQESASRSAGVVLFWALLVLVVSKNQGGQRESTNTWVRLLIL